ncbi:tripartite tricarboxylate transporter substrate binding protein [Roseomonas sp. BN140053]|uniref:tripartite tricarboxylate transporter substrate binding protein n=1 Tax=Roseomonas sp. BN140053 TaxID=3391898 RepID=UPI0039E81A83
MRTRRGVIGAAGAAALGTLGGFGARAQSAGAAANYPDRSVRIIVPFGAGGGNDILARTYGQKLGAQFGQTFVVENRPGAFGRVGIEAVMHSRPDGYTLGVHPSGPILMDRGAEKPPYDLAEDLVPVAMLGSFAVLLLVAADAPFRTLADLIAWEKSNKGKGNFGTGGADLRFAMEMLNQRAGTSFEYIAYRSSVEAINAAASRDTTLAVADTGPAIAALEGKRVRALAVVAPQRLSLLPEVPTTAEAGYPGIDVRFWIGLFAPAGTPPEVVAKLSGAVAEASRAADLRERLAGVAMSAEGMGAAPFRQLIQHDAQVWRDVAEQAGVPLVR